MFNKTIFNLFLFCFGVFESLVKTFIFMLDVLFALVTFRFWIRNACIKGLEFERKEKKSGKESRKGEV